MVTNIIPTLALQFPVLAFFAQEADNWLQWAKTKTILQQLESRKIHSIWIGPILSTAGLGFSRSGEFEISFNEFCSPEEAFFSLGHEIAHTFHFDLSRKPPTTMIEGPPHYTYTIDGEEHWLLEDFCDAFAKRWMKINTKQKIRNNCRDNQNLLLQTILMFSNFR